RCQAFTPPTRSFWARPASCLSGDGARDCSGRSTRCSSATPSWQPGTTTSSTCSPERSYSYLRHSSGWSRLGLLRAHPWPQPCNGSPNLKPSVNGDDVVTDDRPSGDREQRDHPRKSIPGRSDEPGSNGHGPHSAARSEAKVDIDESRAGGCVANEQQSNDAR